MPTDRKPDWGTFRIESYDDPIIIQELTVRAAANRKKPGESWSRVAVEVTQDGVTEKGFRVYHLDLNAGIVEITETWNGVECARRTVEIEEN